MLLKGDQVHFTLVQVLHERATEAQDVPFHICQYSPCSGKLSVSASPLNSHHYKRTHPLNVWYAYIIYIELNQLAFVRQAAGLQFTPE